MIDFILDIMEQISESFSEALNNLVDFAKCIAYGLLSVVLILTIPIWIVPLRIWRRRRSVTKSITKTITKSDL